MVTRTNAHQFFSNWRIRRHAFRGIMTRPFRRALPERNFIFHSISNGRYQIEGEPQTFSLWLEFHDSHPFKNSSRLARILRNNFDTSEHHCSLPARSESTHAHLYEHLWLELASRYWPGCKVSGITIHPPFTRSYWVFIKTHLSREAAISLSQLTYKIIGTILSSKRLSNKWINQEIVKVMGEQAQDAKPDDKPPTCYIQRQPITPKNQS